MLLALTKIVSHNLMIEADNKTIFYEDGEAKVSLKVEKPDKFYCISG
jgi:hypothetical protein